MFCHHRHFNSAQICPSPPLTSADDALAHARRSAIAMYTCARSSHWSPSDLIFGHLKVHFSAGGAACQSVGHFSRLRGQARPTLCPCLGAREQPICCAVNVRVHKEDCSFLGAPWLAPVPRSACVLAASSAGRRLHNSSVFDTLPNSRWIAGERDRPAAQQKTRLPAGRRQPARWLAPSTCKLPLPKPRRRPQLGSLAIRPVTSALSFFFFCISRFCYRSCFDAFSVLLPRMVAAASSAPFHAVVCFFVLACARPQLVGFSSAAAPLFCSAFDRRGRGASLRRFESPSCAPIIMFCCLSLP